MSKRTLYTIITPLPPTVSRETAVEALHTHAEMIQLNPLVIKHSRCKPHAQSPPDEFHATWYELTDRISYLPGIKGNVKYKACFHDLPKGLQTHVYAPAGLEIKEKWTIGGNAPGEVREVMELGLVGVPRDGLYLREDVDMQCNLFLTNFVRKNLKRAHAVLVDRLVVKADLLDDQKVRAGYVPQSPPSAPSIQRSWTGSVRSGSVAQLGMSEPVARSGIEVKQMPQPSPKLHQQSSWDNTSPTLASSGSSSMRSMSLTHTQPEKRLERRASYMPTTAPVLSPRHPLHQYPSQPQVYQTAMGYGQHSPYGPDSYEDIKYVPEPIAQPPNVAELPADDSAMPAYTQQQQFQEDQIRSYLEKGFDNGPMRRDSSMYVDRLKPLGSQPLGLRSRSRRHELE